MHGILRGDVLSALAMAGGEVIDVQRDASAGPEWESYRWGPVSTSESGSGLMDGTGYFHQWHPGVYENAKPDAVDAEVNAQVERALAAGIDVTHVDSHMGTILHPNFIESYVQAAAKRTLPNLLPNSPGPCIRLRPCNPDLRRPASCAADDTFACPKRTSNP